MVLLLTLLLFLEAVLETSREVKDFNTSILRSTTLAMKLITSKHTLSACTICIGCLSAAIDQQRTNNSDLSCDWLWASKNFMWNKIFTNRSINRHLTRNAILLALRGTFYSLVETFCWEFFIHYWNSNHLGKWFLPRFLDKPFTDRSLSDIGLFHRTMC